MQYSSVLFFQPLWAPLQEKLSLALLLLGAFVLGGCCRGGAAFVQPTNGAVLSSPVTAEVTVNQPTSNLNIVLDGANITSQFTTGSNGNLTVPLTLLPGSHTLTLSCSGMVFGQNCSISDGRTFTVKPPPAGSISLSTLPSPLAIERGKTASIPITITRTAPFSGNVSITASGLPSGVTQTALTIPAGSTTGTLTFNAVGTTAISFGSNNLTVTATDATSSGAGPDSKPLKLIVSRDTGSFAEANPTPYTNGSANSTVASLSSTFSAVISAGPPAVSQSRKAVFLKGTQTLSQPVGFDFGPKSTMGGAGFCADSGTPTPLTQGVVMTGNTGGFSADNEFIVIDLFNHPNIQRAIPVEATKTNAAGYFFEPRIFFSHDCTLAIVAGSNKIGPSNNQLLFYDLLTGNPFHAEIPMTANTFTATVTIIGNQPTVQVTVDGTTTSINIP